MGNDDDAVEESSFRYVGNTAVDDDAGVENLVALLARLFAAEDAAQRGQIQEVAFIGAYDQSDIGHDQHDHDHQKALGRSRGHAIANHEREKVGADDSHDAADGRADQALQAHDMQSPFKDNNGAADQHAESRIEIGRQIKRTDEKANYANDKDKENAYKSHIHSDTSIGQVHACVS